jgi:hypothetical protein
MCLGSVKQICPTTWEPRYGKLKPLLAPCNTPVGIKVKQRGVDPLQCPSGLPSSITFEVRNVKDPYIIQLRVPL